MARTPVVVAVDAGTTGIRALVIDERARVVGSAYRELTQHFPEPGRVEHDAEEIRDCVLATLGEVAGALEGQARVARAIGITNQRETVVAWDRNTGEPVAPAIVWQDRRSAHDCTRLVDEGHLPLVRERTGLVLDPYFSATKIRWMLDQGGLGDRSRSPGTDLVVGTVDSWVLWNLTGGTRGGVFATDATNASRTLLYDIGECRWSDELCGLFGVPPGLLPEVRPSSGRLATVADEINGGAAPLRGVPISGMAGDQHAALFGQCCFDAGDTKVTYGTGSFVLMNAGTVRPDPQDGLLTTLAWDLGDGGITYALEGSVFVSGAGVQWLRDGLGVIERADETEALARSVASSAGLVIVPAFTGLGSPHWDPEARGTIVGLSRGIGRGHLARAMVEAMAFQVGDVTAAMARSGTRPTSLKVDGGASQMDLLLQLTADQARHPVVRPASIETTAIGAATLAGLAEGLWTSVRELAGLWEADARFEPVSTGAEAEAAQARWLRAVERSRRWHR
ncbi:MAG: FGGY family carbohydrate kinase [Acidimicrobiales bacterium]